LKGTATFAVGGMAYLQGITSGGVIVLDGARVVIGGAREVIGERKKDRGGVPRSCAMRLYRLPCWCE
jgi:hypothetical protein